MSNHTDQSVPFEWKPGDVILDLYEVRKVTEGFGENAVEKDYHEGGFGRVYKVWHRTWRREMAVKTPRAGMFTTPEQKDTFTRECEVWINLGLHPNVAPCHYVRNLGNVPRVFSEYADAGTLEEWIRSGRLYEGDDLSALGRMIGAAIQFAWGLHYAHERGVIHQDVKPLNALRWKNGTLMVTDFGIARARQKAGLDIFGTGGMHTVVVPTGGMTPSYCSPEQAAGEQLDRRTDVWSWAVSVLEMFQGEVMWQSGSLAGEALEAFLKYGGKEEDIPAMPMGVADLLHRCFQKNPANRPRTLRECAAVFCEIYNAEIGKPYPRIEPNVVGDTPDALNNRALSMLDLGKPDEAEQLFDQALELDRHHLAATYNRGLIRWRAGRCTDTDVLLSIAEIKKEHPNEASVECALGWVRMENADFVQANLHFEKAIALGSASEIRKGMDHVRSMAKLGTGQCMRTFIGHSEGVISVAISHDGRFALSGSYDNTLRLWNVSNGECLCTLEGHAKGVIAVSISPDDRYALSGSIDKTLRLWNLASGKCLRTFEGHMDGVKIVAFSPDSRFALSGSADYSFRLWDIATGQCLRTFEGKNKSAFSIAFSPDGRLALFGSGNVPGECDYYTFRLWDLSTGQCLRTFEGNTNIVSSIKFSPNGRFALSGNYAFSERTAELRLWDIATGQCLRTFVGHKNWWVLSVSFSPDGRFALSGSQDYKLRLWDIATGQCLRTFEGHRDRVHSVAFSPDGRFALSGSLDKTIRMWNVLPVIERRYESLWFYSIMLPVEDALKRQRLHEVYLSQAQEAIEVGRITEAIAFLKQARAIPGLEKSPESLELQANVGTRARIKCYGSGWLKRTFKGHTKEVSSVAFSPDGRFALSGSFDTTLRLWDIATEKCIRIFEGPKEGVKSVAFSPDGRFALSGSKDGLLRHWDIVTGKCLRSFEGHTNDANSVAYSPDGRFVLSGSKDRTLKFWDVNTGRCLRTLEEDMDCEWDMDCINSVSFSPDGKFAISSDYTLRLWDLVTGECLRTFDIECSSCINSVVYSPDGRFALSGDDDKALRLWDITTGQCLHTFEKCSNCVESVSYSPDGRFAVSGDYDNSICLWEILTGKCLHIFKGHTESVNSVSFSPNGRFALSGSFDKTLRLWELDWEYEYDPEHDPVLKRK